MALLQLRNGYACPTPIQLHDWPRNSKITPTTFAARINTVVPKMTCWQAAELPAPTESAELGNVAKFKAELIKNPKISAMRKLLLADQHNIINKTFLTRRFNIVTQDTFLEVIQVETMFLSILLYPYEETYKEDTICTRDIYEYEKDLIIIFVW